MKKYKIKKGKRRSGFSFPKWLIFRKNISCTVMFEKPDLSKFDNDQVRDQWNKLWGYFILHPRFISDRIGFRYTEQGVEVAYYKEFLFQVNVEKDRVLKYNTFYTFGFKLPKNRLLCFMAGLYFGGKAKAPTNLVIYLNKDYKLVK